MRRGREGYVQRNEKISWYRGCRDIYIWDYLTTHSREPERNNYPHKQQIKSKVSK